jgi:lysophospholipase L1-like esterase
MKRRPPVLLICALLAFLGQVAPPSDTARAASPGFDTWEPEIRRFERADSAAAPAQGAVVFTGSSSIRMWQTLSADFSGISVLNRGFGGSEIADATHFAERVVVRYHPRTVVLYAGDNDLNNGRSAEEVAAAFRAFVARVRQDLPRAVIVYIAIKPSPSRWALVDKVRAANAAIQKFCAAQRDVAFVDVFTPMLTPAGRPRPELFLPDSLHMTPAGYALWTRRVRPRIEPRGAPAGGRRSTRPAGR